MGIREELETRINRRRDEQDGFESAGVATEAVRTSDSEVDKRRAVIIAAGIAVTTGVVAFAVETARMVREHDLTDRGE